MKLSSAQTKQLLTILENRFTENMKRHKSLQWGNVETLLRKSSSKLSVLWQMEETGGQPDVVAFDKKSGQFTFFDCSPESPAGRRSLCYDNKALNDRKENKPKGSALGLATEMGVEILSEEQYKFLHTLGNFDLKTSSWLFTPLHIRVLGGAIFGDCRYQQVFTYHNGAESYYAARGFRSFICV